jgi:non-specific serine/threonine protein kinase
MLNAKPGLGKTVIALAKVIEQFQRKPISSVLIVVPKSTLSQFVKEIGKHTFIPSKVVTLYSKHDKFVKFSPRIEPCITVATYSALEYGYRKKNRRNPEGFGGISSYDRYDMMIIDEGHYIGNPNTNTFRAVVHVASRNQRCMCLSMSGTFYKNNYKDLFAQGVFLNSHLEDNAGKDRSGEPLPSTVWKDNRKNVKSVKRWRKDTVITIDRSDCILSGAFKLPDSDDMVETIPFPEDDEHFREIYLSLSRSAESDLFSSNCNYGEVIRKLGALRQTCNHTGILNSRLRESISSELGIELDDPFGLYGEPSAKESPKIKTILDIIDKHLKEKPNTKFIVYSSYLKFLRVLELHFLSKDSRLRPGVLYGRQPDDDRANVIDGFSMNATKFNMILSTPKSGGLGLNLMTGDSECVVIFTEPQWNKTVTEQGTCRAFRIGQSQKVYSYHLVIEDTIEEWVYKLAEIKDKQSNAWLKENMMLVPDKVLQGLRGLWELHMYQAGTREELVELFKNAELEEQAEDFEGFEGDDEPDEREVYEVTRGNVIGKIFTTPDDGDEAEPELVTESESKRKPESELESEDELVAVPKRKRVKLVVMEDEPTELQDIFKLSPRDAEAVLNEMQWSQFVQCL